MVIGPDFVFLAVPRTASNALTYHWLPQYGGALAPGEYHRTDVPEADRAKFTFAVVRSPYERIASLWRFCNSFQPPPADSGLTVWPWHGAPLDDFPAWMRARAEEEHRLGWTQWNKWLPQAEFLEPARVDRIVLYQHLERDLKALPFVNEWHDLPRTNDTRVDSICYSRDFIRAVNEFEAETFRRFDLRQIKT